MKINIKFTRRDLENLIEIFKAYTGEEYYFPKAFNLMFGDIMDHLRNKFVKKWFNDQVSYSITLNLVELMLMYELLEQCIFTTDLPRLKTTYMNIDRQIPTHANVAITLTRKNLGSVISKSAREYINKDFDIQDHEEDFDVNDGPGGVNNEFTI